MKKRYIELHLHLDGAITPDIAKDLAALQKIKLPYKDERELDDSNPFELNDKKIAPPEHKNMGKSSMSFLTSLALSFNNLKTKKGRTFLTAFAGSIGIIGIALILSLSTGVNQYITDIQKDTMTSYPITIEQKTFDLSSMMNAGEQASKKKVNHKLNAVLSSTDI